MSDVIATLRRLKTLIEEHAAADPDGDRIAEPVVEAVMRQSDLMRLWLPSGLGGQEISPTTMLNVVDELTYMDGATAWVGMAAVFATTCASAFCGLKAAGELWGPDRLAILQGAGMPGRADVVDGGYNLSGKWSYGSGIKHATHVYSAALVYQDGKPLLDAEGNAEVLMMIVPFEQVRLGGNWDVLGLRRTGSVDYTIENAFVTEEYTHSVVLEESDRGGPLYRLGMMGLGCLLHTAWAIGNGRRALDELSAFVAGRPSRADGDHFPLRVAQVHAQFNSACAWVREVWADIEKTLDRDEPLSTRQQTLYRLALNHVTFVSADVTEFVFRSAGGTGLRAGRIQQCFRDANASTQHRVLSDGKMVSCGRDLLGLAEGHIWVTEDDLGLPPEPVRLQMAAS